MPGGSLVLSWRDGVSLVENETGALQVEGPGARLVLRLADPAVALALKRLSAPGADEERLTDDVLEAGGPDALSGWYYHLQRLARRGLIVRSVVADGQRLASLLPVGGGFSLTQSELAPDLTYVLCRFAYLRREGDRLVLESPRGHARVVLDDGRLAGLIGALATPGTTDELARRAAGVPGEVVPAVLSLLDSAGMLRRGSGDDESDALRAWEFHDLLFHARSRKGRSDAPFGATYRMAGVIGLPPGVKPPGVGPSYALERPEPERLAREDPPLARVVEARRSIRTYGARPITASQLGEFLFRVGRVDEVREVDLPTPTGPVRTTVAPRPYPSGGGLYELEFYATVQSCDGLPSGLYHYDPAGHRLVVQAASAADIDHLIHDAAASAAIAPESVQVLLIVAARFSRLSWKYASIAYSLVLKHVGVVYQSMYLAATAMGLAPCALGGGDSDLFSRAAGTEYYAETSVGEFLLGSRSAESESDRSVEDR